LDASLGSECESVDEDEAPRKRDRIKSKAEESHLGYDVAQRRNIFDNEELDIELGSGVAERSVVTCDHYIQLLVLRPWLKAA